MIWYTYTYLTTKEILEKSWFFSSIQNVGNIIWMIISAIFIFTLINYLLPYVFFWLEKNTKARKKQERKQLMKQILLQREIEDEIEKEL